MEIIRNILEIAVSLTFVTMLITTIIFTLYIIKEITNK